DRTVTGVQTCALPICPVAGIDATETLDASPMLRAAEEVATTHPGFTNLPRKYKTTVTGCASLCTAHEINDISFVGVTGPGGTPRSEERRVGKEGRCGG